MSEFSYEFFAETTAEDQTNYFFGDEQLRATILIDISTPLLPGTYRVVEGNLCRIVSGLSKKEVRARLSIAKKG